MWVFRVMHRYNLILILQLLNILPDHMINVQAHICQVGQEKDKHNKWRWVLPYKDPCKCTSVKFGGLNTHTPARSFDPVYVDNPWVGNNVEKIRDHYNLHCEESVDDSLTSHAASDNVVTSSDNSTPDTPGDTSTSINGDQTLPDWSTLGGSAHKDLVPSKNPSTEASTISECSTRDATTVPVCMDPLGMENGDIPDENIQASSSLFPAKYGRLNNTKSCWTTSAKEEQWIQADIGFETSVAGVITQGDGGYLTPDWVTSFKVSTFLCADHAYCNEVFVACHNETVMIFPGNVDVNSAVTALFPKPVHARIVRITCLTRHRLHGFYQLRFEILGCKKK